MRKDFEEKVDKLVSSVLFQYSINDEKYVYKDYSGNKVVLNTEENDYLKSQQDWVEHQNYYDVNGYHEDYSHI